MRFGFDEDALLLQATLRDFLARECTPDAVRAAWESDDGMAPGLWKQLADLGIPGLLVPEAMGGLGMDETTAVLLFEEAGRAALPGPLVGTVAVAAPLLRELGGPLADAWLPRIAAGEAVVAVGHPVSPLVEDAGAAGLLLLFDGGVLHGVDPADAERVRQPADDPSRRLYEVRFRASSRVASGAEAAALAAAALDRGALAAAAGLLGAADRLLELASDYARERVQFGAPIGSFQAVKHQLAEVAVAVAYARPALYRAAWSVAHGVPARALHVSMAKGLASEAARRAARTALQVHGAIGYTWEQDLHLWMRRAWSLEMAWGRRAFHRSRVGEVVLDPGAAIGPGETFARAR